MGSKNKRCFAFYPPFINVNNEICTSDSTLSLFPIFHPIFACFAFALRSFRGFRKPQAKYRSRSTGSTVNIRLICRSVIERKRQSERGRGGGGRGEGVEQLSKLSRYTSAGLSPCFVAIDSAGANSGIRMQS